MSPRRSMPLLQTLRLTHPRFSSDTTLSVFDAEGEPVVLGVADMIGRPIGLPWRNYMRTAEQQIARRYALKPPDSLDALTAFMRDELQAHSRMIREIATRHDRSAFGFCVVYLLRHKTQCRILWLGDSRAYRITRAPDGHFQCDALTRDHNGLDLAVREKGEFTLFRRELMELGKQLQVFLGAEPDAVRAALQSEWTDVPLEPNSMILLATDGLCVPMIRMSLDRSNDHLSMNNLYLTSEFTAWFDRQPDALEREIPWANLVKRLLGDITRYTSRHTAYRDDIAINALFP